MKQLVGQLFVIGFDGLVLPPVAHRLLGEFNASGAILFKRNIESIGQVVSLNTQIVGAASGSLPALISVDQEGGKVARLRDICTNVMSMRKLAQSSELRPNLIYRTAAMMGRELASLGFHLNYAPIADVDSNPLNPIIADRAFGSDPDSVGHMIAEFIRGMQSSGIAACAKHFPGHGDTQTDSHLELPVVLHDLARLATCELIPFQKAIAANVATIMTAHVLLPKIDDVPATLSYTLLTRILRKQLSFEGLIISDDLEMKGVADHFSLREIILKGLNAGVDLFLICSDTDKAQEAIMETRKLLESGEIRPERIQQSLERIQAFKERYIGAVAAPDFEYAKRIVQSKPHTDLLEHIL